MLRFIKYGKDNRMVFYGNTHLGFTCLSLDGSDYIAYYELESKVKVYRVKSLNEVKILYETLLSNIVIDSTRFTVRQNGAINIIICDNIAVGSYTIVPKGDTFEYMFFDIFSQQTRTFANINDGFSSIKGFNDY